MAAKALPAPEVLRQLLEYEPDTGKLFSIRCGRKEVMTYVGAAGYPRGSVCGVSVVAHRVAWALQTGEWPTIDVDHINGVRHDNRWVNLRLATRSQNQCNMSAKRGSRFKGVSFLKGRGKWQAEIQFSGERLYIGVFKSEIEAAAAYDRAAVIVHGEYARLNLPHKQGMRLNVD